MVPLQVENSSVTTFALKVRGFLDVFRCFRNPFLVVLLRFGVLRMPFFLYRIRSKGLAVQMLGRPAATSLGDLFVLRELFIEETYRDLLPLLPKRSVTVLDVGSNLGSFMIWLHRRHGISRGFTFEPEPTSFQLCRFNLFNNSCPATAISAAMGGQARKIQMIVGRERPGGLSIYARSDSDSETADVDVLAFDDWLEINREPFDVLKLDCEGAEWEILDCTPIEVFSRFTVVVAEVHADGKHPVDSFPQLMTDRGFQTVRWDGHSHGLYIGMRGKPNSS
jgi:FkbM family methyltransferase